MANTHTDSSQNQDMAEEKKSFVSPDFAASSSSTCDAWFGEDGKAETFTGSEDDSLRVHLFSMRDICPSPLPPDTICLGAQQQQAKTSPHARSHMLQLLSDVEHSRALCSYSAVQTGIIQQRLRTQSNCHSLESGCARSIIQP